MPHADGFRWRRDRCAHEPGGDIRYVKVRRSFRDALNHSYTAGRVVQDGAFANWTLQWPAPHALTRNFKTPDGGGPDAGFLGSNY